MRAWDAGLDAYTQHDEVVIWCEHDLFDQLLLIRHLGWFGRKRPPPARLSLICIGDYPGFERFMGLGQLAPEQLAGLLPTRAPVTPEQLRLGADAWAAFTAPEPIRLEEIARDDSTDSLPFLGAALRRLLEEYPATRDGLSRTEHRLLGLLLDGPAPAAELFTAMHRDDDAYHLTDLSLIALLEDLSGEPAPAIKLDPGGWRHGSLPGGTVRLTELGQALLAGEADRSRSHPLDRWIGRCAPPRTRAALALGPRAHPARTDGRVSRLVREKPCRS